MTLDGAGPVGYRHRVTAFWAKHRSRWALPLVIIVVIIIVAAVDRIEASRIAKVDQPAASPLRSVQGGTATVDLDQPWSGFNPNTTEGAASASATLLAPVLPSAYIVNPQLQPVLNTNLLVSAEVTSLNPQTISYVINPKAVWSDGVPVTAQDFIYAWEAQRGVGDDVDHQPYDVASTLGYRDIDSVTGSTDGKTVTVVFGTPFTDWRTLFSNMVPAHIAEQVGWNHGFQTFNPSVDLSAGPMVLQSVSASGTAVLVRNNRWWGPKSRLMRIVVQNATSPASWVHTLAQNNGAITQSTAFNLNLLNQVTSLPNTQSQVNSSLTFLQLEFNVDGAVTSQVVVRQAIAHLVDRSKLMTNTLGTLMASPAIDDDHLAVNSQPQYAASTASADYSTVDTNAAAKLLASAGYTRVGSGPYEDDEGKHLVLHVALETGDPWIASVALQLTAQLEAAGIDVVTVPVDGVAGMDAATRANSYDLALVSRTASPYLTTTVGWYSTELGSPGTSGGSEDWSNFNDPDVNQLFQEASAEPNPVPGATYYAQIDDQLWGEMVALPLFQEPTLLANGVQVGNTRYNASSSGLLWNATDWSALAPKPQNSSH